MTKKRIVVVTGGVGLIGKEICRSIVAEGNIVVVADISDYAASEFSQTLNEIRDGSAISFKLDITDRASIEGLIKEIVGRFGSIYALVNNAYPRNKNYGRSLEEVEYQDFCENISTHLGGYFLTSQVFCKQFVKQGIGRIVNMASIYGFLAPRFEVYEGTGMTMPVEYAPIKAGILQMTRYFAKYYFKKGITANCISPGGVFANQDKSFVSRYNENCSGKGMLSASDVANAVIYLLSDGAAAITGQNIVVDDGFSL